jgi:protein CpxP
MRLNWTKLASAAILVGALLLLSIVGFSQQGPPPRGPHGGPHDMLEHLTRELNLTTDQQAAVKKIMESIEESAKPLQEQLRKLHESEPDPMSGAAFDEAAVRSAAQARANIQIELEVLHARAMSQVYALLTADQKAQLAAKRQQFGQRHQGGAPPGTQQDK